MGRRQQRLNLFFRLRAKQFYLFLKPQMGDLSFEIGAFVTAADDSAPHRHAAISKQATGLDQMGKTFVGLEAADADQFKRPSIAVVAWA